MRLTLLTLLGALSLGTSTASAATPAAGPVSATDIQGVSALLKGKVNPQGFPTTYLFEYATASNLSGAVKTPAKPAGQGLGEEEARAAISGLTPLSLIHI